MQNYKEESTKVIIWKHLKSEFLRKLSTAILLGLDPP